MNLKIGSDLPRQPGNAQILHNDGVGAGPRNAFESAARLLDFVLEHQRIKGDVAAYPAPVQGRHRLRQFARLEPHFGARREVAQAEVHRVRPGLNRRPQLWPITCRTHDFGFAHG